MSCCRVDMPPQEGQLEELPTQLERGGWRCRCRLHLARLFRSCGLARHEREPEQREPRESAATVPHAAFLHVFIASMAALLTPPPPGRGHGRSRRDGYPGPRLLLRRVVGGDDSKPRRLADLPCGPAQCVATIETDMPSSYAMNLCDCPFAGTETCASAVVIDVQARTFGALRFATTCRRPSSSNCSTSDHVPRTRPVQFREPRRGRHAGACRARGPSREPRGRAPPAPLLRSREPPRARACRRG